MDKVTSFSFTDNFIKNLVSFIEEQFMQKNKDLSKIAFVFGGKRPALFLKKELARRIKKGFSSPKFFSIDEFIEYVLSKDRPYQKITELEASFLLYNLAREITPQILKGRESFAEFLPWAREIFAFIEQLDLEDIKAKALKTIELSASIGYEVPQSINQLLQDIVSLREAYHTDLKKKGKYCRGLMYLTAAEMMQNLNFSEFDYILFCNFYYLHKTEKELIKSLYQQNKALLFFQGSQEDWPVLKEIAADFSCSIKLPKNTNPKYNLQLYAGFDTHSQVCLVREILKKIKNQDSTVIVLPNPDNVIPLLSEISSQVGDFNVSLGYSVKRSTLYSLFESIFKAQNNKKDNTYYTKDYLEALLHPFVKNLKILGDATITRVLAHKIEEVLKGIEKTSLGGSLFVNLADIRNSEELYALTSQTLKNMDIHLDYHQLEDAVGQLHQILFSSWEKVHNFYDFSLNLEALLAALVEKSFLSSYPFNLKIIEGIFSLINQIKAAAFNQEALPKEEIFKIFLNQLEKEVISFSGSPLKGLQILGLFETRSLNFKDVIVMDTNEAVLPKLKVYEPLIPREVMLNLGLNRLEKEEEIQRYHFLRLLCAAENIHLVYAQTQELEKSRFVQELIWEEQKQQNSLEVLPLYHLSFQVKVLPKRQKIPKTKELIDFLKGFEYSPTSIDAYLECPLRFYYRYVLGLKEKEDLLADPEGIEIGNFIHPLLYETFRNFLGKRPCIDKNFRDYFFHTLDKKFKDDFQKRMKSDSFLVKEILDFRLRRFLDKEAEREVEEILSLEETFTDKIKFRKAEFQFKVRLDRIDRLKDESILIIDYKTGSADLLPNRNIYKLDARNLSREILKNTLKSFQLPLYFYFVQKFYKDTAINACLYNLRDAGMRYFLKEEDFSQKDKIIAVCLEALEFTLQEILNPEVHFEADEEDVRACQNCPFFYLCR
jgi:hypothetical protein